MDPLQFIFESIYLWNSSSVKHIVPDQATQNSNARRVLTLKTQALQKPKLEKTHITRAKTQNT